MRYISFFLFMLFIGILGITLIIIYYFFKTIWDLKLIVNTKKAFQNSKNWLTFLYKDSIRFLKSDVIIL